MGLLNLFLCSLYINTIAIFYYKLLSCPQVLCIVYLEIFSDNIQSKQLTIILMKAIINIAFHIGLI